MITKGAIRTLLESDAPPGAMNLQVLQIWSQTSKDPSRNIVRLSLSDGTHSFANFQAIVQNGSDVLPNDAILRIHELRLTRAKENTKKYVILRFESLGVVPRIGNPVPYNDRQPNVPAVAAPHGEWGIDNTPIVPISALNNFYDKSWYSLILTSNYVHVF